MISQHAQTQSVPPKMGVYNVRLTLNNLYWSISWHTNVNCCYLSRCVCDFPGVELILLGGMCQPNGDHLWGWTVTGFWELSSWVLVFSLRACWDQVKLSSCIKCLAFYSGLFVDAADRDKTGKVSTASASRLHANCGIKNSENSLRSSFL